MSFATNPRRLMRPLFRMARKGMLLTEDAWRRASPLSHKLHCSIKSWLKRRSPNTSVTWLSVYTTSWIAVTGVAFTSASSLMTSASLLLSYKIASWIIVPYSVCLKANARKSRAWIVANRGLQTLNRPCIAATTGVRRSYHALKHLSPRGIRPHKNRSGNSAGLLRHRPLSHD
jgi:hypothetical protein